MSQTGLIDPPTQFAPAGRASAGELIVQESAIASDPVIRALLEGYPVPAAFLNGQRQILLANRRFEQLTCESGPALHGLRPGEALSCVHAGDGPDGCGTGLACRYCGAALAILQSQVTEAEGVQECRLNHMVGGVEVSSDLRVTSTPVRVGNLSLALVAVQDITDEKRRRVLERTFFHDALNMMDTLFGLSQIIEDVEGYGDIVREFQGTAERLVHRLRAHRDLYAAERGELHVDLQPVPVGELLGALKSLHAPDAERAGVSLEAAGGDEPVPPGAEIVESDPALLRGVLGHLIQNAIEASERGQAVRVVAQELRGWVEFAVHNESVMSEPVRMQVFQRSFSTKPGEGRGIGCYAARLITERFLGGRVTFTSGEECGTTFRVRLPHPPT